MTYETIQLSDDMHCTVEPCPIDYFGSDEKRALRVVTFKNNEKVSTWDVYLNEDTRFTLALVVEEAFQNGLWMDLLKTYYPNSLSRFDRPNVVWYAANEWVATTQDKNVKTLAELKNKSILSTNKVFSIGSLNAVLNVPESTTAD